MRGQGNCEIPAMDPLAMLVSIAMLCIGVLKPWGALFDLSSVICILGFESPVAACDRRTRRRYRPIEPQT
jgi:hypothetical protein